MFRKLRINNRLRGGVIWVIFEERITRVDSWRGGDRQPVLRAADKRL